MRKFSTHVLTTMLVLALLFAAAPQPAGAGIIVDTSTREYLENFDALATGSVPCAGSSDPGCFYAVSTAGTGGVEQVQAAPAGLSGKAWQVTDGGTPFAAQLLNSGAGTNLCSTGQSLQLKVSMPDLTLNDVREVRFSAVAVTNGAAPANTFGMRFTGVIGSTNTLNFFARGNTGAVQLSANGVNTPATIVIVTVSQVNCANTGCAVFTFTGVTGLASPLTQCAANGDPFVGTENRLTVADTASVAAATVWVDDYDWQGAPLPAPTVTSVSPNVGPPGGGTAFTLTGTNLRANAAATFGGVAATGVTVVNPTTMTGTTPAHAEGAVTVTVTNADGTSGSLAAAFTYQVNAVPVFSSIAPNCGIPQGGTAFNITGSNFASGAQVAFDTSQVTDETFVSSSKISGHTPPHAAGAVTARLTNPDGQSATGTYTYSTTCGTGGGTGGGGGTNTPTQRTVSAYGGAANGARTAVAQGAQTILAVEVSPATGYYTTHVSQDGGGSWTTRNVLVSGNPVSPNVGTITYGITLLSAAVVSSTVLMFQVPAFAGGTCIGAEQFLRTTDGGLTWAYVNGATYPCQSGGNGHLVVAGDLVLSGTTLVAAYAVTSSPTTVQPDGSFTQCNGAGGDFVETSTDGGATWGTIHTIGQYAYNAFHVTCLGSAGMSIAAVSSSAWDVAVTNGNGGGIAEVFTTNSGTTYTTDTVDDSFNPVCGTCHDQVYAHVPGTVVALKGTTAPYSVALFLRDAQQFTAWHAATVVTTASYGNVQAAQCTGGYAVFTSTTTDRVTEYFAKDDLSAATVVAGVTGQSGTSFTDAGLLSTSINNFDLYAVKDGFLVHYTTSQGCNGGLIAPSATSVHRSFPSNRPLVGFDVDPLDQAIITREVAATGTVVRSYSPGSPTLVQVGSDFATTACTRSDGVATIFDKFASAVFHTFSDCNASTHQVETLRIRNQNLAMPTQSGTVCTDFCDIDVQTGGGATGESCPGNKFDSLSGQMLQLASFKAAKWDWTTQVSDNPNVAIAWAYTTIDGSVGIWALTQRQNSPDKSCAVEKSVTVNGDPLNLCSWRDEITGNDYVAGTAPQANGQVFSASYSVEQLNSGAGGAVGATAVPDLVNTITLLTPYSHAPAMGCAFGNVTLMQPTGTIAHVEVVPTRNQLGTTHWSAAKLNGVEVKGYGLPNTVTVSGDDKWFAFLTADGAHVAFGYNLNGTIVDASTISIPASASFKTLRFDDTGQVLWVVTSTDIWGYDVHASTTMTPVPPGVRTNPDGSTNYCVGDLGTPVNCVTGAPVDSHGNAVADTSDTSTLASAGLTALDGLCITCTWLNGMMGSIVLGHDGAYVFGFLLFFAGIGLAAWVARRTNTQFTGPANGAIIGGGLSGAYILFAIGIGTILISGILAAGAVAWSRRSGA